MSKTVSAKNRFLWLGLLLSCIVFMRAVTAFAGTITLDWDAPTTNTDGTPLTDLAGYKIYYGPTSGNYTNALDVGNVTTSVVDNVTDGFTNYFAITAYNPAGVESSFSNEVSKTPPPPSPQFAVTTFMITASADIGGTITPAGTTGVNYGANQTFTIEPGAGYHVATVLVDGVSKGAVTTYTFTSISANHTIAASFAINTYTITASAGTGGAISPSGTLSANYNGYAIFSITPNADYSTTDVKVDGVSLGAVTTYTFTNVTAAHTIAATFAQNPITASNNYDGATSTFESGFNGYIPGGFSNYTNRDSTQAHTGSYSIVLYSGWTIYNDTEYPDYIYYGPANIYKTITTGAGTLSLWAKAAYVGGLSPVIRITSGGTTEEYALTTSWALYTKTVVGQTNDLIKIEFDSDPSANDYSAAWIDDVVIPIP